MGGLGGAFLLAGFVWLTYVALEPMARRLWPDMLISWSRLLEGRLRDPLVGSHLLFACVGALFVMASTCLLELQAEGPLSMFQPLSDQIGLGERLRVTEGFVGGLMFPALLVGLHFIVRRRAWSQIVFLVVLTAFNILVLSPSYS